MGRIKAIITDFDGTLVNTFKANYYAYKEAFIQYGYELTEEQYKECYGYEPRLWGRSQSFDPQKRVYLVSL